MTTTTERRPADELDWQDAEHYSVETATLRGYTLRIALEQHDTSPADPREYDNLGTFALRHDRYWLGDASRGTRRSTYPSAKLADSILETVDALLERGASWYVVARALRLHYGATVVRPAYLYDHSGISISAGENLLDDGTVDRRNHNGFDPGGWDTSVIGLVLDTAERRELIGTPVEHVDEVLLAEVAEYDAYLQGDVWGVTVETSDGETVESVGWIIGRDNAREEAVAMTPSEPHVDIIGQAYAELTDCDEVTGREVMVDLAVKVGLLADRVRDGRRHEAGELVEEIGTILEAVEAWTGTEAGR
jgi:hypothetical protein